MIGLTELRSMTMDQLYGLLRSTHSDDRNLKIVLNEKHAAGWTVEFKSPGRPSSNHQSNHQTAVPIQQDGDDAKIDRPGDTELTHLVRRALREGYRGEHTDDPHQTMEYMLIQTELNREEREIDFEPIQNFWKMFRDKYTLWRVRMGKVRS
jgi:hypothetical protein